MKHVDTKSPPGLKSCRRSSIESGLAECFTAFGPRGQMFEDKIAERGPQWRAESRGFRPQTLTSAGFIATLPSRFHGGSAEEVLRSIDRQLAPPRTDADKPGASLRRHPSFPACRRSFQLGRAEKALMTYPFT